MCGKPFFQIDGDAGVKTAIITFNNVGLPPHEIRCRLPVVFCQYRASLKNCQLGGRGVWVVCRQWSAVGCQAMASRFDELNDVSVVQARM